MRRKFTYEEVKEFVNNLGYELISEEYKNNSTKLALKDEKGYYYMINLNNLKLGKIPEKFHTSNLYTIHNIKLWLIENNKNFKLVSDIYKGAIEKLKWQCFKEECNEIFEMNWHNIYSLKQGCAVCAGRQVGLSNCLATKNSELAKEWHPTLNGNLTPYDVTSCSGKYVWWQCSKNPKHEWFVRIADRNNGRCCPECSKSKGEKRIKLWLDNFILINYISQKGFYGLLGLGNGNLSYDFYIPKLNLLIEYQGIQHEKPVDYLGLGKEHAEEKFKYQQEHDRRKREYAKKHNINLLEIWYWDYDRIEEILDRELNLNITNCISI